jgi:hypothetical protein
MTIDSYFENNNHQSSYTIIEIISLRRNIPIVYFMTVNFIFHNEYTSNIVHIISVKCFEN